MRILREPLVHFLVLGAGLIGLLAPWSNRSPAQQGQIEHDPDAPAPVPADGARNPQGMVWIPGGEFIMGTDEPESYVPERPAHRVKVDGFWMDETELTNQQFREFVEASGSATTVEKAQTLQEIMAQVSRGTPEPPARPAWRRGTFRKAAFRMILV